MTLRVLRSWLARNYQPFWSLAHVPWLGVANKTGATYSIFFQYLDSLSPLINVRKFSHFVMYRPGNMRRLLSQRVNADAHTV